MVVDVPCPCIHGLILYNIVLPLSNYLNVQPRVVRHRHTHAEHLCWVKSIFFSRIHPGSCINHIEERPRQPVHRQEGYNSTHTLRYIAKRKMTHPLQTR
jgi:hypothetical protein